MTEDEVVEKFSAWLVSDGWTIATHTEKWLDICAVRGGERSGFPLRRRVRRQSQF